jgi:asparagine synthase (glutamine-hydrolysing)
MNRISKVLQASNLPFEERLLTKLAHTAPENIADIIQPGLKTISFYDYYNEAMKGCRFTDPFYKLVYFQHKVTLPGDMLTKVDRMSMAYSIETRIPFLDHRIIELLYGVDKSIKTKGYVNKIILRNAVANQSLPIELLDARKKGFTVPLRDWFKEDSLDQKIRKMLLSQQNGLFDAKGIEKLIKQNKSGEFDLGNFIWMVVVLKNWMDKNKQNKEVHAAF